MVRPRSDRVYFWKQALQVYAWLSHTVALDSCAALVGHEVQPSALTSVQTADRFSWWSSRGWWDPEMYINVWAIWKQQENSRVCDCWRTWNQFVWKCLKQSLLSLSVSVLALYKQLNHLFEQNSSSHFSGLLSLELSTSRRHFCTRYASRLFFTSTWQRMDLKLRWDTKQCKAHLESEIFMLNSHSYLQLLQICNGLAKRNKKCVYG